MKIPYTPIVKAIDSCRERINHLQSIEQKDESTLEQLEHEYTVCEVLERYIPRPPEMWLGKHDDIYLGCPICSASVDLVGQKSEHFCRVCGQVISIRGLL